MKKRILTVLLAFFGVFLVVGNVYAKELPQKIMESKFIFDEKEYQLISKALGTSSFFVDENERQGAQQATVQTEELPAYKMFDLKEADFLASLEQGGTLRDLISEEYLWVVPNKNGGETMLLKEGEKWSVIGYSVPQQGKKITSTVRIREISKESMQLVKNPKLEECMIFRAPMYRTNFIYLTNGEEEFLIPFSSRPDFTHLENGKVYSLVEVCNTLRKAFPEYSLKEEAADNTNGGAVNGGSTDFSSGKVADAQKNFFDSESIFLYVSGGVVLSGLGIGSVFLCRKRKGSF